VAKAIGRDHQFIRFLTRQSNSWQTNDYQKMTCTYFNSTGNEMLVEKIPG
jgi:hypothetical protein